MKRSHLHASALKTFFRNACLASSLVIASFTGASAQNTTDSTNDAAASMRYLGYNNDQLSFLLKYENEEGEKYAVTIRDINGDILFNETFTEKKFSKIFKTPLETGRLTFIITNLKNREEQKFQVNSERRLVEEFSITKSN